MTSLIERLGFDERVKRLIAEELQAKSLSLPLVTSMINERVKDLKDDVYTNMKSIEEFRYKLVEVGVQLENLKTFVKGTLYAKEG